MVLLTDISNDNELNVVSPLAPTGLPPLSAATTGSALTADPDERTTGKPLFPFGGSSGAGSGMFMLKTLGKLKKSLTKQRSKADSVVCFTSPAYYYNESEGFAELDVIRLGNLDGEVTCKWRTKSGSAKAGKAFVGAEGTLTFSNDERHGRVCVALLPSEAWSRDTHFEVQLFDVGCAHQDRKAYLLVPESRVWIMNDHHYPVGAPRAPSAEILLEKFFIERCVARGPKVKVTAYCYVYKSFYNCAIESICLSYVFAAAAYAENGQRSDDDDDDDGSGGVIDDDDDDESHPFRGRSLVFIQGIAATLVLIGATKLLEWCDFKQLDFRGRSGTRKDLRNWLLASYTSIGIETASHANVDGGHMINCLNNHVEEAVVKGWYMLFKIVEAVSGLFFSVVVVLYLTTNEETGQVQWLLALPILPSIALTLYATQSREEKNIQLVKHRAEKEDDWVGLANEVLMQAESIRAYGKQEEVAAEFKAEYEVFYTVHRRHRKFEMGTNWKCHWANGIVYYLLLAAGPLVAAGALSAAKFVVLVKLYRSIDKYCRLLSSSISNMQRASIALEEVREVLNLPSQGHEVGALEIKKRPIHAEDKHDDEAEGGGNGAGLSSEGKVTWSELLSLVLFVFGNNKDPHALHAPEFVAGLAAKAKAATKVVAKTTERRISKTLLVPKVAYHRMSSSSSSSSSSTTKVAPAPMNEVAGGGDDGGRQPGKNLVVAGIEEEGAVVAVAVAAGSVEEGHSPPLTSTTSSSYDDPHCMAHGTGALYHWVFNETDLGVFDHMQLQNVTVSLKKPGDGHGMVVVDAVTLQVPLGHFYVITGKLKQVAKGVGRGIVLEVLSGMRVVDSGLVGIPPHLKTVMLTESYNHFFDKTIEECIIWGHPRGDQIKPETVRHACQMAGISDEFISEFPTARKHRMIRCSCFKEQDPHRPGHTRLRCRYKVGKNGRHVRVVLRASMLMARALLADVDVIILNRTEGAFHDEARLQLYTSLKDWIENGLEGAEMMCAGVPRRRTVFISLQSAEVPLEADFEMKLGTGVSSTGIEVHPISRQIRKKINQDA